MTAGPILEHGWPCRPGERLVFIDDTGRLEEANFWSIEVEGVAHHGGTMPEKVAAIDPETLIGRDLTAEFESAVSEAMRPEAGFPSSYVIRNGKAA